MTSGVDGLLKLWQIRTAECAGTFEEHTGKVGGPSLFPLKGQIWNTGNSRYWFPSSSAGASSASSSGCPYNVLSFRL